MDPRDSLPGFEFSCVIFSVILTSLGLSILICETGNQQFLSQRVGVLNEETCKVDMGYLALSKVVVRIKGGKVSLRGLLVCGRGFLGVQCGPESWGRGCH